MQAPTTLPQAVKALVPRDKILGYLLSNTHSFGVYKATFFNRFGFRAERWELLAEALRTHAKSHAVAAAQDTDYGTRYIVEGPLDAPDGRNPVVRALWFVDNGAKVPRIATAYPIRSRP